MPKCNQCDSSTINGVYCHEFGCPNWDKIWDDLAEEWVDENPDWEDDDEDFWDDWFDEDEIK